MKNIFSSKNKPFIFPKVDLSHVDGVLIDLDNTLYFLKKEIEKEALHKAFLLFYKKTPLTEEEFINDYKRFFTKGFEDLGMVPSSHNRMLIFQHIAEFLRIDQPFLLACEANDVFFKFLFKHIKPEKKAVSFLKKCKRHKIPVCLVTDLFAQIQVQKLKALKLEKYISYIVSNDETGHDKPHTSMFQTALKKLDLSPSQVVMIGDDAQKDIQGAQELGIKAYQVILNDPCKDK